MNPTEWNSAASAYSALQAELKQVVVFPFVERLLTRAKPLRVLDFGCGDGSFAAALVGRLPAAVVHAYDSSEVMARLAGEGSRDAGYEVIGKDRLHTEDGYDAVVLLAVWMSWETDDECAENLKRIRAALRPGGMLIAAVTHPAFRDERFSTFSTTFRRSQYFDNGCEFEVTLNASGQEVRLKNSHWNLGAMSRQLSDAGFVITVLHELPDQPERTLGGEGSPWLVIEAT